MSPKKIILTSDKKKYNKRIEASVINSWAKNPELDGYRLWSVLGPFWKQGFEVEIVSADDYLRKNPADYLFALVMSKNFATFPRWKGRLVAFIKDPQSVTDFSLDGYSGVLATYVKFIKEFALEKGYNLQNVPVLWHPNLIHPEWVGNAGQRPISLRKNFLVTGAIDPYKYPDRYRLYRSIRYSLAKRWRYGVHLSNKLGFQFAYDPQLAKKYQGKAWFYTLSSYKTIIFGRDRWGYFVGKYTEIPACGCLMVAPDIEEAREAGLVADENYLAINVDRFWDTIEWIRSNEGRAEKIRKNGVSWVHEFAHYVYHDLFQENITIIMSK